MARIARKNLNTPFLHVMVQGVNKEYVFQKEYSKRKYLNLINELKVDYSFTIMAYCIMDNHCHLLIYTEDIEEFGKFMHKLNFEFATLYNKIENRVGVLFRNRYKAEPIYNERYLVNCIKYIHDNPLKAGLVRRSKDYNYSSCNDYINNGEITKSAIVKKIFGKNIDYLKETHNVYEMRFMDIEDKYNDSDKYIINGIYEYKKIHRKAIVEFFLDKEELKKLINFLKVDFNISYIEIANFFEISKRSLFRIKK